LSYTPEEVLSLAQRPARLSLPTVVIVVHFVFGLVFIFVAW